MSFHISVFEMSILDSDLFLFHSRYFGTCVKATNCQLEVNDGETLVDSEESVT